jgi:prepilin-type N-terminal cleavage/methylation domain-containing protein
MMRAFTLIELLIVVAIIAILAAIAVPNFQEALTRAKVSRVKADMRTSQTALETYMVDHNAYPNAHMFGIALSNNNGEPQILERLSTPVAYLSTALLKDPFILRGRYSAASASTIKGLVSATPVNPASDAAAKYNSYIYQSWNNHQRYVVPADGFSDPNFDTKSRAWLLHSCGPDGNYYNLGGVLANDGPARMGDCTHLIFDATNGTVSRGSVFRAGGQASSTANYAAGTGILSAIRIQP